MYRDIGTDLRDFLLLIIFLGLVQNTFLVRNDMKRIINAFEFVMVLYGCIFFIQYVFKDHLPEYFLNVPNLVQAVGADKYTRVYEGFEVYRPNALMGNPISLGFFCNMVVFFGFKLHNASLRQKICFRLLPSLMIVMLLSRVNISVLFVQWILAFSFLSKKMWRYAPWLFALFLIGWDVLLEFLNVYYIRITGADERAIASNLEHLNDYLKALEVFVAFPVFGVSQSFLVNNEIITDGGLITFILRFGSFGTIFLLLYTLQLLKKIGFDKVNISRDIILLFCFVVMLTANSAINNPINFLLLAVIINFLVLRNKTLRKDETSVYYRSFAIK